jgi:hypothetical protein
MLTKIVDVNQTQTAVKDLVSLAVAGTEVVFMEGSTPLARLVSVTPRVAGLHSGAISTSEVR